MHHHHHPPSRTTLITQPAKQNKKKTKKNAHQPDMMAFCAAAGRGRGFSGSGKSRPGLAFMFLGFYVVFGGFWGSAGFVYYCVGLLSSLA